MIKQLTTNGKKVLLVEVPEGAQDFRIIHAGTRLAWFVPIYKRINLPPGSWQLVGLGSEIKEEQWEDIVHMYEDGTYECYDADIDGCSTATRSGLSLIRSEGMKPERTVVLIEK